jgi:hypothetical protein
MADIIPVTSLKILGVYITNGLSASATVASGHVHDVIRSCAQILYALRVLRARGTNNTALQAIFRPTVIAKLLILEEQFDSMNQKLFGNILANQDHLLSNLLPPPSVASQNYSLRPPPHSQELPQHT